MPPPAEAPFLTVEEVRFPAGRYRLHGDFAYAESADLRGAAVLAGPHPLLGGDLHNNVMRGLGDGLAERRVATLRFNYRGVGQSEGPAVDVAAHLARFWQTSHAPDEADLWRDVQGAADFVSRAAGSDLPLALVGYSFGCSLLPRVRTAGDRPALVLIAPTVGKHDYAPFLALPHPVLVIASEDDFATDAGQLRAWFGRLPGPKQLVLKQLDSHFFRGHEAWLAETVFAFLQDHWR
jgi:alpha/beta superfamily hydrolase